MMTSPSTDQFGYPRDERYETKLVGLTAGTGWFACSKFDPQKEDWFFHRVPQFMTVARTEIATGEVRYCMFGVHECLGELERLDHSYQFMGYAHESEFIVPGKELSEEARVRMEYGEFMCGDPSRHLDRAGALRS